VQEITVYHFDNITHELLKNDFHFANFIL